MQIEVSDYCLISLRNKTLYPVKKPKMENYLGVAREEGLTDEEIGAVQSVVMAVSAGRVGAQFRDACALD
jgi:hypothetical protein